MRQPSSAATRKRQEEAKKRAETQRKRAEADKKKRAEAERKRKAEADKKKKAEAAAKKKAEADAARLQRQQSSTSMMGPGMMGPRQPQYPPSTYDSGDGIPQETNAYGEPIPTGEDAVALKESMNSFSKIRIFEDAGAADEAPAEEPAE